MEPSPRTFANDDLDEERTLRSGANWAIAMAVLYGLGGIAGVVLAALSNDAYGRFMGIGLALAGLSLATVVAWLAWRGRDPSRRTPRTFSALTWVLGAVVALNLIGWIADVSTGGSPSGVGALLLNAFAATRTHRSANVLRSMLEDEGADAAPTLTSPTGA